MITLATKTARTTTTNTAMATAAMMVTATTATTAMLDDVNWHSHSPITQQQDDSGDDKNDTHIE
jgi:hypothetical protein